MSCLSWILFLWWLLLFLDDEEHGCGTWFLFLLWWIS